MRDKSRIKIDSSLDFVEKLLKDNGLQNYEFTNDAPDIIISEKIPTQARLFIVIWDRHDVDEIDALISNHDRSRCLRGFFLKNEVKNNPGPLIKTIHEAVDELNSQYTLREKAAKLIEKAAYFEIGSLVKISKKAGSNLELEYGNARFTTLFIDKPMLELMFQLNKIQYEIEPQIAKFLNDYKGYIDKVEKTRGIISGKVKNISTTFDDELVKNLYERKNNKPVKLEPILLTGNTGVGKTLIAKWIHEKNKKNLIGTFQEINSSALTGNLLESELFGHVEGAWTDAKTTKPGKALLALGGVMFLDEIGDMPLEIQPRVMKFVEDKMFTPEGWTGLPFHTPLLIIAATNRDLDKDVADGKFRQDFYARFKHRVHVPSIEERKPSLSAIIDLILQNPIINPLQNRGRTIKYVSFEALEKFKKIEYMENFRGLERIVSHAAYKTRDYGLDIILAETIDES